LPCFVISLFDVSSTQAFEENAQLMEQERKLARDPSPNGALPDQNRAEKSTCT
jgi:hypothetical protein